MDFIQFTADIVNAIARHGWSVTTFVVAVTALLRVNAIRRMLLKRLPKRFRQEDRLDRLEHKIDALMSAGGVIWDADLLNGKTVPSATDGAKKNSYLSQVALWPVRIIALFTQKKKEIYHLSGRYQKMKSYLKKLGRTKFQALLVSLVINIVSAILFISGTLDIDGMINQWMPIINMTIGTISTWVYIAVEGEY